MAKPKILMIEDDEGIVAVVRTWLDIHTSTLDGYKIEQAQTMAAGRGAAEDAILILLDLTLPDSNPRQSIDAIIDLRVFAPVIVLTGFHRETNGVEMLNQIVSEKGADAVVFKDMIMIPDGLDWLFTTCIAAIQRRIFNIANFANIEYMPQAMLHT